MTEISRTALFGKLNPLAYQALESATTFCKMRGNPYVELVHWLHQLLQLQDSDLHRILRHFELDQARLAKELTQALDALPRGATSLQDLSAHVEDAVERGWVYGSLLFGDSQVRSGYLLVGALKTRELRRTVERISAEFKKIAADTLSDGFSRIVGDSPESDLASRDGVVPAAAEAADGAEMAPATMGKQEALAKFSQDLTEKARRGELDPIVGRDDEIRQIIDILMRRRQNNPILTGEAGVGKTAVVEGFALRIARGDVPPPLQEVSLRVLDVGLLQAGASYKGEFEKRLRQVIDEVQLSATPIILFIDEAHTLIGAGGSAGTGDAANLLKPALARGTLRTIAATTWAEYKKYIEKDPALTRRFQVVQILEPDEEKAIGMMRAMAAVMETHHRVEVLDEALEAAVRLSHRYIPARQLPDKAVSLLDTACARVAISQHAVPAEVDDCRQRIVALETELEIIGRETALGMDTAERAALVEERLNTEGDRLAALEENWNAEKDLIDQILALRRQLKALAHEEAATEAAEAAADAEEAADAGEAADSPADAAGLEAAAAETATESEVEESQTADEMPPQTPADPEALRTALAPLQEALAGLQGESPLILPEVGEPAVAAVVADWTGIPVGRMVKNEIDTVLQLPDILNRRILGQRHALESIAKRVQTSRAKLDNPSKPIGVVMLAGPSGVGKTETALALAEALYGGEQNVVTINMSEFQEAHTVSTLKGAPPGYVGYGEGGVLTEAVRRKPYSVILLDEVEKAHADVHEIFFQVFDKGRMEDGEGRLIDFKNTLILLTTNIGTERIMHLCRDPEQLPAPEALAEALRPDLLRAFPAALLGRMVTIPYYPLSDTVLGEIVALQLGRIQKRIEANHKIPLTYEDTVVAHIVSRCTDLESGGRMIDAILTNTILPTLSRELLTAIMEGREVTKAHLGMVEGKLNYAFD